MDKRKIDNLEKNCVSMLNLVSNYNTSICGQKVSENFYGID